MNRQVTTARRAVEFLLEVNSLEAVPRAGYVMSGVEQPEDVAAHTTGVAAAALMIADRVEGDVDRGRLLTMALLHDIGESRVGDIPLIRKTSEHEEREAEAADAILEGLPDRYAEILEEYHARETLEARIVYAADKVQLMAKVMAYQRDGRGHLDAFWENLANFRDAGLEAAEDLYRAIRDMRTEE